jgi:hypothetical protein
MSDWMAVDPAHSGTDMMYMDMGLMEMAKYYYRVMATNAVGDGEWSDGMSYAMTPAPDTTLGAASNVEASASATNVTIMWDGGENADTFTIVMVSRNADGGWDVPNAVWKTGVTESPYVVDMESRPAGTYIIGVAAGQDDGSGGTTWEDWAQGSIDYQP